MSKTSRTWRASPLEVSHGITWMLGALFGLCVMEFGVPVGVVVAVLGLAVRLVVERWAARQAKADALDEWFR